MTIICRAGEIFVNMAENGVGKTHWEIGGAREMLTKESTEKLMGDLLTDKELPKTLESIRLSGKSFGVDAAHVAAGALLNLEKLRRVDLSDIIAGRPEEEALQALEIISGGLKDKKFTHIHLSDNALGKKGKKLRHTAYVLL